MRAFVAFSILGGLCLALAFYTGTILKDGTIGMTWNFLAMCFLFIGTSIDNHRLQKESLKQTKEHLEQTAMLTGELAKLDPVGWGEKAKSIKFVSDKYNETLEAK